MKSQIESCITSSRSLSRRDDGGITARCNAVRRQSTRMSNNRRVSHMIVTCQLASHVSGSCVPTAVTHVQGFACVRSSGPVARFFWFSSFARKVSSSLWRASRVANHEACNYVLVTFFGIGNIGTDGDSRSYLAMSVYNPTHVVQAEVGTNGTSARWEGGMRSGNVNNSNACERRMDESEPIVRVSPCC